EFKRRGLNDNPSLLNASLAQRLAFGSRLDAVPLRRTFGRQQVDLTPAVGNNEWLISGDMQFTGRAPANASAQPTIAPVYSGLIMAQGDSKEGYRVYFIDNKMYFTINQEGKAYQVTTKQPLPSKFSFKAALQKNGVMTLM